MKSVILSRLVKLVAWAHRGVVLPSCVCMVLAATASPAVAAEAGDVQASLTLPHGATYWPGAWTAFRYQIRNETDRPIEGTIELPIQDAQAPLTIQAPVWVPPGARARGTIYAPAPSEAGGRSSNAADVPRLLAGRLLGSGGGALAQIEVLGQPVGGPGAELPPSGRGIVLVVAPREADARPAHDRATDLRDYRLPNRDHDLFDVSAVERAVVAATDQPTTTWHAAAGDLPRHPAGYDAVRVVALDATHADDLDAGQRAALLTYVRAGGTLLLADPLGGGDPAADPSGTWLAPHLPVQLLGTRSARAVPFAGRELTLRGESELTDAAAVDGATVVAGDAEQAHAAHKPLGLGRVAFASFPVASLPDGDDATELWRRLLDLDASTPPGRWEATGLADAREEVLNRMTGRAAPPWGAAAGIAGGYGLLVLGSQLAFRGPRRPRAFATASVLAVVATGGLVAARSLRGQDASFTAARIATLDLAADGGGLHREALCLYGTRQEVALATASPDATLRPASSATDAQLGQLPFTAPSVAVNDARIDQVWQAIGPAPADWRLTATGTFGPDGLALRVNNTTPISVAAPLLLWGRNAYRLPALTAGATTATLTGDERNPPRTYQNTGAVVTETDKQRAAILSSLLAPPARGGMPTAGTMRGTAAGVMAGWVDDAAAPRLIESSMRPAVSQGLVLVRFPVAIAPSAVGSKVTIDAGFNVATPGPDVGAYDIVKGEWIDSSMDGEWLIGFAPPREAGALRVEAATVTASVQPAGRTMTLRRGQVRNGAPQANPAGEVVAEYRTFGRQPPTTFQASPNDVDAAGRVWLLVQVEGAAPTGGETTWRIDDLGVSIDATVTGPPLAVAEPTRKAAKQATNDEDEDEE